MSKYAKQKKYQKELESRGLSCVRVVIPTRSMQMMEEWAAEECATLKEERDNGQEPSIQYAAPSLAEDILMSDYVSDIPNSHD